MKRALAWIAVVAGVLALLAAAACGAIDAALGRRPMPAMVGNNPPGGLSDFASPKSKYRVAVLGDAQKGVTNLRNVLRSVKEQDVDFILQTGDLVSNNDEGHYRLAALTLERADLRVPMAVVPGNHDLKDGPERFARELGDREFRFRRGSVVFVVMNNASGWPPAPARLEAALRELNPDDAVVLAMHVPPFDANGNVQPRYEPFLDWLEKSRVKYLLCGHVHSYFKKQVGGTTVLVNGVGGDYDKWQLDQKVYATILEVDGRTITDRAIELPPEHSVRDNLEHLAIGHAAEAYRRRPALCWGATLLVLGLVALSIRAIRRPAQGKIEADRASVVP